MAELTEREHDVYEAIRDGKTFRQIAEDLGVTPQRIDMICVQLRIKGVIRRRDELPATGRMVKVYPWELVDDQPPFYKPAMPPHAKLRLSHPRDSARDVTVPPIRQVWWPTPDPVWSVQGIPMLRPDGLPPYEALTEHRLVVVSYLPSGLNWSFIARVRRQWFQAWTQVELGSVVTDEDIGPITLLIAAAVGVDAVMDLNDKEPHQ